MHHPPEDLVAKLKAHNQLHVLTAWDGLDNDARAALVAQIRSLDLDLLAKLYANRDATYTLPPGEQIIPLPDILPDAPDPEAKKLGEQALARGEVAVLLVAGGQGTRLGFDHPKGMFQVGPVTGKSLFQIHAEKVLARSRRHGHVIPFLVMTSDVTHEETVAFFEEHKHFGLPATEVFFFRQGTMPALDLATGKLLMDSPGRLFLGPDGHGGTLTALASTGLLELLHGRGIQHIFYFQVDNPLVKIADPQFIGQHIRAKADVSSKAIPKDGPHDRLGNFVLIDGKLSMIEYSDLPEALANATDGKGQLRFRAGSPAIHVFDVEFLRRITAGYALGLPFHLARKKVPYWDSDTGTHVQPQKENALKFERFIFDVLPLAQRSVTVFTARNEEFAPLKNASGADSPEVVRKALSDLAADWLRRAGANVDGEGELNPLTTLEPDDLRGRFPSAAKVKGLV
ncbi:MAG: UTP--glucose-1-phosphate uridylyltransferase [Gemmataceae bacterium]